MKKGGRMAASKAKNKNLAWQVTVSFFEGFIPAVRSVGFLSVAGALGGLILVYFSDHLELSKIHPGWAEMAKHVGLGFVVSSIAVFGYEWRAHSRKTLDLTARLVTLLETQSDKYLKYALAEMFSSPEGGTHEVAGHLENVAINLSRLLKRGGEAHYYVSFFSGIISGLIESNIQEIESFYARKIQVVTFRVLSTAHIVSDVLAAQMSSMKRGEKYEVISDFYSWREKQLESFQDATGSAVGSGVEVVRIFNLWATDDAAYREMTAEQVKDILEEHLRDQAKWGEGYQVYYFGLFEREEMRKKHGGLDEPDTHVGIFSRNGRPVIGFEVVDRSLERIRISQHPDDLDREWSKFSDLKNHSTPLKDDVIERAFREYAKQKDDHDGVKVVRTLAS
jgi:hypothetical protein